MKKSQTVSQPLTSGTGSYGLRKTSEIKKKLDSVSSQPFISIINDKQKINLKSINPSNKHTGGLLEKLTTDHASLNIVEEWRNQVDSNYLLNKALDLPLKSTLPFSPRSSDFIVPLRESSTVATTTTTSAPISLFYYPSFNSFNSYKKNEFYSVFISILTAAAFAVFIMWRWLRMKADLKRAFEEQQQIQQNERSGLNMDCAQDECVDNMSGIFIK